MFNKLKQYLSRFTDKPISTGVGLTTTDIDPSHVRETISPTIPRFMMNGTNNVYVFVRVSIGRESGTMYYILEHVTRKEELVISSITFDELFSRVI